MATQVLTNAYCLFNGVDLTDHVKQIEVTQGVDMQDATAMTADTKINKPGLKTGGFKITFFQDFAAGKIDATIAALQATNPVTSFTLEVRPTIAIRSPTNPAFVATVAISAYNPVAGSVGDMQLCDVELALLSSIARLTA